MALKSDNSQAKTELMQIVVAIAAIASLALSLHLLASDKAGSGVASGVLGLLLLAFMKLSKFKRFKGLGFEAELWEETQKEAETLIAQTKELLAVLAKTTLTIAPRMGRWGGGFSRPELIGLRMDIERLLKDAKVPFDDTSNIDKFIAIDITIPITQKISKAIQEKSNDLTDTIGKKFESPIGDIDGYNLAMSEVRDLNQHKFNHEDLGTIITDWPSKIQERIELIPTLTTSEREKLKSDVSALILDLEAWVSSRTIRRPDIFNDRTGYV